jgi:hypothetical protein
MFVFACGSVFVGTAFVFHLVWWKIHVPQYQSRSLLLIFLGVLGGGLVLVSVAAGLVSAAEYCQIALFVFSFAAAYIITYSAIEADSPTLVLVQLVWRAGPRGLREADLRTLLSDDVLVKPRLADLVRDGMLIPDADGYRLTFKGRCFCCIFISFRALLGAQKGG